jgi:hypothetical protein
METFIDFLPIAIYSLIGTALFYLKKITFNNQVALVILAFIAHAILTLQDNVLFIFIGQIVISITIFLLLVFFFAGKTSGETILSMTSLVLLTPIPHGIIPMFIVFALILIASAIALRNKTESLKWLLYDAASSTGLTYAKPDYSHLPDRSTLSEKDKRTSVLPFMALVSTIAAIYYLVQPMFLDS